VHHAEDADLYWRASEIGSLENLREVVGYYRSHADSITGRSLVDARIQATFGQLAAISAQRRARLEKDLDFPGDTLAAYRALGEFEAILDRAGTGLSPAERVLLASGASLRLQRICSYRRFSLEEGDIRLLKNLRIPKEHLTRRNRREIRREIYRVYSQYVPFGRARFFLRQFLRPHLVRGRHASAG
jgi:hypothetical protein